MVSIDELVLEDFCLLVPINIQPLDFSVRQLAREEVNMCVGRLVNYTELQIEIEKAKPTGDLDLVFSKYCRKSPVLKECVTNFTTALDPCLEPKEKQTKKVFQNVSESLLDFICFKEGDRIALFIAEGGPECLSDKKEAIQHCMNITLSKFIPKDQVTVDNIPVLKLEKEECTAIKDMHMCVVHELEKCNETTPSNIVDALMKFMMQQTPCKEFGLYPNENAASPLSSISLITMVSLAITYLWR
ncbi:27 kDa glycoprotein [Diaphorina citri]|uniref:27 kDa glycoprotein n=1 Tax=Diaphorina citri TaxID=121845 RepID=A0A1S3DEU1_DIACI|nr:27 kDa glycoprotein [Diaphorina citri]